MVGVIIWALAVIAIFLLLKEPYDYKFFIACYKGLIFSGKWIGQFLLGRWEWFKSLSAFKQAYLITACIIGIPLSILFVALCIHILLIKWSELGSLDSAVRNLAIAFIGTISGFGALFGVYLAIRRTEESKRQSDASEEQSKAANTQSEAANKQSEIANRQANTAEQGLITDRINKATEGLGRINDKDGEPVIVVRLGALYALERIAQDSLRDHIQIMDILCAYIRTNSPLGSKINKNKIREDIDTALTIIGRRDKWPEGTKRIKQETQTRYVISLRGCNLNYARLRDANLSNAWIDRTLLNYALLERVNLNGAWLDRVELKDARLDNAKVKNAFAHKGDFSNSINLTQEQINGMYCGIDVKIPDGLTRPDHWPTDDLSFDVFDDLYYKWRRNNPL